ncbi:MAG: domain S-box protein, partial [Flavipsychrobacter sp.]|nr:domain S-box protein [Flavipsychrobacter sp.]
EAMELNLFTVTHPDDISEVQKTMARVLLSPGIPITGHTGRMRNKNGAWRWVEATVTNMLHDPGIGGIVDNFRDVTERVLADEKIIKANRLYSFISQINQTIVHAKNEQDVFKEACRIAIESGGFKMAWLGTIDVAHKKTTLIESCNIPLDDIPLFTNVTYDDNGPLAHVLKTNASFIYNDIEHELELPGWKQYAVAHEVRSVMILPIRINGTIVGSFNLYATEKDFFDEQEIMLLEEAASDISFALGVFEKDRHRKEMEDKVIHSELKLNQAQAIAHLGSWDLNFSLGVATWSDEACRIYGFEITDNLHSFDTWISFVYPEDREYVMQEIEKGQKTLTPAAFHHRIMLRNGEVKHIYSQSEFELNKEGVPIGIHGVAHDLTGIKNAEAGLSRSEANLLLIMDLIPQSIFAKDYYGKFVFVNKSFASLYGLNPEDILNKSIKELIPQKGEYAYFQKQDQEVILSGKTQIIPEHTFTDSTGKLRLFHTVKVPFTVAGTNEKAVLGITMDITKEKQAEEERTKMINDIVLRNKDLEQFSYIISHNLRAPVANMMGIAEVLQIPGLDKADERMMIAELENSVKKIDEVIRDLNRILQVKHTENKKREVIILSRLLHDIESGIEKNIKSEEVQIIVDFSAIDKLFTIKSYMYSILFNLISNSIKYRRPEIHPVNKIKSALVDNKVQLIYHDNGLGIDLEKKGDQVFGLYKRFHQHVEGKGMGLFMVKTHVESLGGKITITSEVNKGTGFLVEFDIIEQ